LVKKIIQNYTKTELHASINIGRAAEAISLIDGTRVIAMAVGAAQIVLKALPTPTSQDAIDPLNGTLRIVGFLRGGLIVVVIIPILTPLIDIARHVVDAKIVGGVA
jgi:hypothetical protein